MTEHSTSADMLAQNDSPLTDETVHRVIAALEPPRHFAETYGTKGTEMPLTGRVVRVPYNRWIIASAIGCALIPLGCLLLFFAAGSAARAPATDVHVLHSRVALTMMASLAIVGYVLTPIVFWLGIRQLRKEPTRYRGREVALGTMAAYLSMVSLLLLMMACVVTEGLVLFLLGITAFVYFQYLLVRRIWQSLANALPPDAAGGSVRDRVKRDVSSPMNFVAGSSMATS